MGILIPITAFAAFAAVARKSPIRLFEIVAVVETLLNAIPETTLLALLPLIL